MMKSLLLFALLITNTSFCQNTIEVKYSVDYSGAKYDSYLVFNQEESYFEVFDGIFDDRIQNEITKKNDDGRHIRIRTNYKTIVRLYKHIKDSVYLMNTPDLEAEGLGYAYDDIPHIEWKIISNSTKTILVYVCQRAEAKYRGSLVVAYFTTKIPTNFAPDKFKGLPGLILEVYDATSGYVNSYKAYAIDFSSSKKLTKFTKNDTYLAYRDFVKQRDEIVNQKMNEIARKRQSLLPRDVEFKREFDIKRVGFEKIYEWEEDQNFLTLL